MGMFHVKHPADDAAAGLIELSLAGLRCPPPGSDASGRLWRLAGEFAYWGPRLGLSAVNTLPQALVRHVLDSLLLARLLEPPGVLVDVGTGVGAPALPLAIVWPDTRVVAVDSRRRSRWLVERLSHEVMAQNVEHYCTRAERLWRAGDLYRAADVVCARALAKPSKALDLCRPFARPTGIVALFVSSSVTSEDLPGPAVCHDLQVPGSAWRRRIAVVGSSDACAL